MKVLNRSVLTTAQAAEVLDVHESSIKRWCNEGLIRLEKTDGRHRRIALTDLLAFSKKQGNEARIARFDAYAPEVYSAVKGAREEGDPSGLIRAGKSFIEQGEFFHLKNLFHHVLEDPRLGKSFLFDQFFAPLMAQVGTEWESGIVDVAVEHYVSECLSDALNFARYEAFSAQKASSRIALVACSEGNWHSFGSKCAQIILQASGYTVHYLGVSTPYADLAKLMRRLQCRTLVLSFSRPQSIADIQRCLNILSEHHSEKEPFSLHIGANFLTADFLASAHASFPVSFHRTFHSFETLLAKGDPT